MSSASTTGAAATLDGHILRTLSLFQGIIALPTALFLGIWTFIQLINPWEYSHAYYYYFFTDFFTALMAAGIIFIVVVQRRAELDTFKTLIAEASKSTLATGLWLWLLLDSLFGPWQDGVGGGEHGVRSMKRVRIVQVLTAVILLLLFFYSALVSVYLKWQNEKEDSVYDNVEGGEHRTDPCGERQPLLSRE